MDKKRPSRAGRDRHKSGNYVRSAPVNVVRKTEGRDFEMDAAAVTHATKAPITLPRVGFLERPMPKEDDSK